MLQWIFLESTIALAVVCGLALFGLLVYWRRSLNPRPLVIGMALAAVLLIVQAAVVTDRERVYRIMRPIELAIMAEQIETLRGALAVGFSAGGRDREEFSDYVETQFERVNVDSVRLADVWIDESGENRIVATLRYGAEITARDYQGLLPTVWQIWFIRAGDEWRIERIQPRRVGLIEMRDWVDFERL